MPETRATLSVGAMNIVPTDFRADGLATDYLELERPLDGRLDGLTAYVKIELIDDRLNVVGIRFEPDRPLPLDATSVRSLRDIRLGDLLGDAETCLGKFGEQALPWLKALRSDLRRPGRRGITELELAEIASCRVEAQRMAAGAAIAYMVQTWPHLFVSASAAHAKVNRAIHRGFLDLEQMELTDKARNALERSE